MSRPFAWEKSYPAGVRWDAPIETSTVPAMLEASIEKNGGKPAIEYRDREISFAELGRMVDRAAAWFLKSGADSVGLYLPNTPYHPIAFFGALKAGLRVVHMSPLDAERELAYKLKDSGARIVVTINHPMFLPNVGKLRAEGLIETLVVGDEARWGPAPGLPPIPQGAVDFAQLLEAPLPSSWPALDKEAVAVLQYTGGTTGLPKAAMLSHANLTAAVSIYDVWSEQQQLTIPGEDKVIVVLPLFHIYALTAALLRPMKHGNQILLRARFDPEQTVKDIEKGASVMMGVPTMWIAILSLPGIEKRNLSALRYCASGGASLPVEVEGRVEKLTGQQLLGGWGMTETSPAGTNIIKGGARKPGTIGVPLPGIEMEVVALDDPRRVLPPGEKGEFRIRGPNVTKGYWNKPQENETAFVDGWFLTGDTGYMDEDGYFFLVDRKKDMIISGGFNVYPRMIEEAIWEHPDVEEVIVIGVPDPYRGEAAKAFIKLKAGRPEFTLEALRAFLADKVGKHELPAAVEFRDALPKTAVGKLSKKELVEEERRKRA